MLVQRDHAGDFVCLAFKDELLERLKLDLVTDAFDRLEVAQNVAIFVNGHI